MTASATSEAAIVDTNVLVFAHDVRDAATHKQAAELIQRLLRAGQLTLSAQVFNEFYSVVTRPNRSARLSHDEAARIIRDLASVVSVISLDASTTLVALDGMAPHGLSFWDALIWSAAKVHGVATIYSEDYQHGREIEGVSFVNPFV